jgi:hypothetical protein
MTGSAPWWAAFVPAVVSFVGIPVAAVLGWVFQNRLRNAQQKREDDIRKGLQEREDSLRREQQDREDRVRYHHERIEAYTAYMTTGNQFAYTAACALKEQALDADGYILLHSRTGASPKTYGQLAEELTTALYRADLLASPAVRQAIERYNAALELLATPKRPPEVAESPMEAYQRVVKLERELQDTIRSELGVS